MKCFKLSFSSSSLCTGDEVVEEALESGVHGILVDKSTTEKLDIERKEVQEKSAIVDFDKNLQTLQITDSIGRKKSNFAVMLLNPLFPLLKKL